MITIRHNYTINAPKALVWHVITHTADYPLWNPFVIACHSSFEVGAPIVMKVMLVPPLALKQKETVRANVPGELLEYGVQLPFGMIASSRKHLLRAITADTTEYQSLFELRGSLAPLVSKLLGPQLERGFREMTDGLVARAEQLATQTATPR